MNVLTSFGVFFLLSQKLVKQNEHNSIQCTCLLIKIFTTLALFLLFQQWIHKNWWLIYHKYLFLFIGFDFLWILLAKQRKTNKKRCPYLFVQPVRFSLSIFWTNFWALVQKDYLHDKKKIINQYKTKHKSDQLKYTSWWIIINWAALCRYKNNIPCISFSLI